jgi:hypothetical protein
MKPGTEERNAGEWSRTLPMEQVETIAQGVRSHWGIENRLHRVLDVAFREDGNRTRKGNVPECSAILRPIVLNLFRQDPSPEKKSIKIGRLKPAMSPHYRLAALLGFPAGVLPQTAARPAKRGWVSLKGKVSSVHPTLLG